MLKNKQTNKKNTHTQADGPTSDWNVMLSRHMIFITVPVLYRYLSWWEKLWPKLLVEGIFALCLINSPCILAWWTKCTWLYTYMYIVENSLQKTVIGVDFLVLHFTYIKRSVQQYSCNLCKALIQTFFFTFCCWRLHTLAYVASSGQLYSFGAGENGQLGNNRLSSVNSPVLVHSSWHADTTDGSKSAQQSVIHRIAAGGDFCYLLAPRNVSNLLLLICKR